MFSWALDTYEKLNFVYRKDFRASDDVTISVSTGSGKVEVYDEGTSSWVEANTYNFSQQITEWAQGNMFD